MLSLALSVWMRPSAQVQSPPAFTPSLDFTDARNSGYAAVIGF